jgi:phenylpyruvate tautomerase
MPLLRITTSANPSDSNRTKLLQELSSLVAQRLGKPEAYMMTSLEPGVAMTFAGATAPACFVELKSIGRFTPELTAKLSAELCDRLERGLDVPKDRIYIDFADAQGYLWGHGGETFG